MLIRLRQPLALLILTWVSLLSCISNSNETSTSQGFDPSSLEKLKEQYPDSVELQLEWTKYLINKGDSNTAVKILQELSKKNQGNTLILNSLAYTYLSRTDTLSSIREFKKSLIVNDKQPEIELELAYLYASKKNDTCTLMANVMISDYGNQTRRAHGFFALGIYLSNTGDVKRAIQAYDSCIVNQYTYTDAYLEKSILLYDLNKNKESLATLFNVLEIDSKNSDIFAWIGFNYLKLGNQDKAKEYFTEALRLNPNRTDINENLK